VGQHLDIQGGLLDAVVAMELVEDSLNALDVEARGYVVVSVSRPRLVLSCRGRTIASRMFAGLSFSVHSL